MIIDPSVRPSDNLSGDYAASAFWAAADVEKDLPIRDLFGQRVTSAMWKAFRKKTRLDLNSENAGRLNRAIDRTNVQNRYS